MSMSTAEYRAGAASKPKAARKTAPRNKAITTCHTCGETFTGETGEARHCATTGHGRYDSEFEVVA